MCEYYDPEKAVASMCRNFKALREKHGLSVGELAAATTVEEEIISAMEAGDASGFDSSHLLRLCVFFGVSADMVFWEGFLVDIIEGDA